MRVRVLFLYFYSPGKPNTTLIDWFIVLVKPVEAAKTISPNFTSLIAGSSVGIDDIGVRTDKTITDFDTFTGFSLMSNSPNKQTL